MGVTAAMQSNPIIHGGDEFSHHLHFHFEYLHKYIHTRIYIYISIHRQADSFFLFLFFFFFLEPLTILHSYIDETQFPFKSLSLEEEMVDNRIDGYI